ncbi:hypothetical protein BGZ60DRAFT_433351 [Tricladium varicosporioides]|nr:hypothetical protein BGZ60DRAFT_433351 [Hymenoscyphus varicosporioides]
MASKKGEKSSGKKKGSGGGTPDKNKNGSGSDQKVSSGTPSVRETPKERYTIYGLYKRVNTDDKPDNSPIGPRNAVYLINEPFNQKIDRTKVTRGVSEPRKMTIRAMTTKKEVVYFKYHVRKDKKIPSGKAEFNWNSPRDISDLNKWRSQIFRRVFKRDPNFQKNPTRTKWTKPEYDNLAESIKEKAASGRGRLTRADWEAIAKAHNERFKGKQIKIGDELMKPGDKSKGKQTISERTASAIQALCERTPALKALANANVTTTVENESDIPMTDTPDNTDEDEKDTDIDDELAGDLDHNLEDPSDDEKDGMRPAGNPTGAASILAS